MQRRLRTWLGGWARRTALFAAGLAGCAERPPAQADGSGDLPVTAGYEAAIAAHATKPVFRPSGTAPAIWGPGDRYSLLITGEETGNAFFQFEAVVPSGGGPPPHRHRREDESFYVVRGQLEILLGDSTYHAQAGDFVFIPRGTVHRFRNLGNDEAVQLVTFVPAGVEGFFREVFPAATDRRAAPPPVTEALVRKMNEVAPRYGLEILPPPGDRKP